MIFLRLGSTSFGGPVAHLGYFHDEFVVKRKWLDEDAFTDLISLCQFLPGPASSQVGLSIGLSRAGWPGALAAWLGFTLPSAVLMILFGYGISFLSPESAEGWLHGLKVVAVAIVAYAIWGMGRQLCYERKRMTIAIAAAGVVGLFPFALVQISAIATGALLGFVFLSSDAGESPSELPVRISRRAAISSAAFFIVLILSLPLAAEFTGVQGVRLFDRFFRVGALVFGGGHVVLPLLRSEVVGAGWVDPNAFMAGYGAAQALPGPLFTFAAYLGSIMRFAPTGWLGGLIALVGVFLPSFFLVTAALPFWKSLRRSPPTRRALGGVNAAVVGLLLAAFYNPVWTSAIFSAKDFAFAGLWFVLLSFWRWPSWAVVVLGAIAGFAI